MRTVKEEQLQKEVEIWKSRANAHEQNYLQMLKRIDEVSEQLRESQAYADKLVEHKDMICLPKDLEVLREANLGLAKESALWQEEAKRWRDMYMEYDEMLEGHINDAVKRLDKVWEEINQLKKQIEDDIS
jgi:hypothetical protein